MYTIDEQGKLNNYAVEPPVYEAVFPSEDDQRRYVFQGAFAILFVTFLMLTAFSVS